MPDPKKILATIERATVEFRQTTGRAGSIVRLGADARDVLVVGDLHGHIHVFAEILRVAELANHPGRHLIVQEPTHDPRIDPDEGEVDRSHRLIDLVCALKCQYPDRVHWVLGNHELSELTGRSISKKGFALNNLFRLGVEADYGEHAAAIIDAYNGLFAALPIAVRTANRVHIGHTIPDSQALDDLDPAVMDLDEWPADSMKRGGSIYALTWGRDDSPEAADRFAALVDADLFISGHQPCDSGYRQANHRTLILDGTDPYPTYCLFPASTPIDIEHLLAGVRPVPMPRSE